MAKNYYLILGVDSDAIQEEIKTAYRRRAMEVHPDQGGAGAEPFQDLQEAYAVLADSARRRAYDRSRGGAYVGTAVGVPWRDGAQIDPIVPVEEPADFGPISVTRSYDTFRPSFDEIFDHLWSNFRPGYRPKSGRVQGLNVEVPLSRSQALRGGRVQVSIPAEGTCPACRGRGGVGFFACWECDGGGTVTREFPVEVPYPAGLTGSHTVSVPLDHIGITNLYLTVHFRPTAGGI